MRFGIGTLLLLCMGLVRPLAAQAKFDWVDRIVVTGSTVQRAEFSEKLRACDTPRVVQDVLGAISEHDPLPIALHDASEEVLFATVGIEVPSLDVDLADFRLLPTADQVRGWPPDSSWAVTYCEILLHELAEALEYQRRYVAAIAGGEWGVDKRFQQRDNKRAAHAFAIAVERDVAAAQRTRLDSTGNSFIRHEWCNDPELGRIHMRIGDHTQTFLVRDDRNPTIEYGSKANRCAEAGLPARPNVPQASE